MVVSIHALRAHSTTVAKIGNRAKQGFEVSKKKESERKQGFLFKPMGSAANERMRVCRQEPSFSRAKRREIKHDRLQARK